MLKIKDTVNLEELKKFGFCPVEVVGVVHYALTFEDRNILKVNGKTRFLSLIINSVNNKLPGVILELFKNDLLENRGKY